VRERLATAYGASAALTIGANKPGGTSAVITLPTTP
jgi:hypothetical protein